MATKTGVTVSVFVRAEGGRPPGVLDIWVPGGIGAGGTSGPDPEPDWAVSLDGRRQVRIRFRARQQPAEPDAPQPRTSKHPVIVTKKGQ